MVNCMKCFFKLDCKDRRKNYRRPCWEKHDKGYFEVVWIGGEEE